MNRAALQTLQTGTVTSANDFGAKTYRVTLEGSLNLAYRDGRLHPLPSLGPLVTACYLAVDLRGLDLRPKRSSLSGIVVLTPAAPSPPSSSLIAPKVRDAALRLKRGP